MKLRADRKALVAALKTAGQSCARGGNVLLQADAPTITVTGATDETVVSHRVPADVAVQGAIVAPLRPLVDVLRLVPDQCVRIAATPTARVRIEGRSRLLELQGAEAKEFRPLPCFRRRVLLAVSAPDLALALERTIFAAADDPFRPILAGIHLKAAGTDLRVAAADGFRLSVQRLKLRRRPKADVSIIVIKRALQLARGLLHGLDGVAQFHLSKDRKWLEMRLGDASVAGSIISGQYPDVESLIPGRVECRAEFCSSELLAEAKASSPVASIAPGINRLECHDGARQAVSLSLKGDDPSASYRARVPASVNRGGRVALNNRYLIQALELAGGMRIHMDLTSDREPVCFGIVDDPSFDHVIMPMFVNWDQDGR